MTIEEAREIVRSVIRNARGRWPVKAHAMQMVLDESNGAAKNGQNSRAYFAALLQDWSLGVDSEQMKKRLEEATRHMASPRIAADEARKRGRKLDAPTGAAKMSDGRDDWTMAVKSSRRHRAIRANESPRIIEAVAAAIDPQAWEETRRECFVKRRMVSTRQAIRAIKAYRSIARRKDEQSLKAKSLNES